MDEEYEQLSLPSKDKFWIKCNACNLREIHTRPGVEPGHSYIEMVAGTPVTCSVCKAEMKILNEFMYGFVKN